MKRNSANKLLFLNFLREGLNGELYQGLRWKDKRNEIFYVDWIHKSSQGWNDDNIELFKAWAALKGKLKGKNEKSLKATFRCALNSKKELKRMAKERNMLVLQFIDPKSEQMEITSKKTRKHSKSQVDAMTSATVRNNVDKTAANEWPSLRINSRSETNVPRLPTLPAFESLHNFEPLTPPHQANEVSYNFKESQLIEKDTSRKENYVLNSGHIDRMTPSILFNNATNVLSDNLPSAGNSCETENSAAVSLPSFESFCSFRLLTPPPQMNEVCFNSAEFRTNHTSPPDNSRLTPPQENYLSTSSDSFHQFSTDVWEPNCWPLPRAEEDFGRLNQFPATDFIRMNKCANQELENNNDSMDFLEMDQYVPVLNTTHSVTAGFRNGQSATSNRIGTLNVIQEHTQLESVRLDDDYFLNGVANEEKIMQELERLLPCTEYITKATSLLSSS